MKFVLSSSNLTTYGRPCEGDKLLLESARNRNLEARITDPKKISYFLQDGKIKVYDSMSEITDLDILLVRRTRDAELESYQFAKAMEENNAVVVDPSEALKYPTAKLIPNIVRKDSKYSPPSIYISDFSEEVLEEIVLKHMKFPLAIKPQNSDKKRGFKIAKNKEEVMRYFKDGKYSSVIFQAAYDIITYYRALTIGGKPVGFFYFKGTKKEGGEKKVLEIAEDIVTDNPSKILGVDIWRLEDGRYFVAECNRNPTFLAINKANNKRYDRMIIDYCIKQREGK